MNLASIIKKGQQVRLKEKVNLNSGCDLIEVSEFVNNENKALFLKVAYLLNTDILGIDFICQDISQPCFNQDCAIIECNSLPYIDMHHYPSDGKSQNVAQKIVELMLNILQKG